MQLFQVKELEKSFFFTRLKIMCPVDFLMKKYHVLTTNNHC